jgi:hypothetical protein
VRKLALPIPVSKPATNITLITYFIMAILQWIMCKPVFPHL